MTDKATIQPKSKPEKTTISISGETSERLEIYCRANGILRKEFVSLALEYFERTGFDLKSNALDYSPLEKIIGELNEVKALKQQDGKDIWLVGGGQVITLLLNHDLVDEMQICYIPVILGNGIPLFPNQPKESTWKFAGSEAYDSGIVKITYVIG
jgi:riboflavin biosynthesis pyrimidine reductase